jgi:hypothetical protein
VTASWRQLFLMNFPLALSPKGVAATVFRAPATQLVSRTGATVARKAACGDSDDLLFDTARPWLYVSCGSGAVEVFDTGSSNDRKTPGPPDGVHPRGP